MQEVARFEDAGDTRVIRIGLQEAGSLAVEEIIAGRSCFVAYGESSHTARIVFEASTVTSLLEALGYPGESPTDVLRGFAGKQENTLVDLMDLCDTHGVSYAYMGVGDTSGIQYRPVG